MRTLHEEYLDWHAIRHAPDCKKPQWQVDYREDESYRSRGGRYDQTDHRCSNEDCDHDNHCIIRTIRLVCRGCRAVVEFTGEPHSVGMGQVRHTGFGQPPRKVAGLWVYPGPSLVEWEKTPWECYVSNVCTSRLTREDIVGHIGQARTRRGAVYWWAAAIPTPKQPSSGRPSFQHSTAPGQKLTSQTAAVRWVAFQLAVDRERRGLDAGTAAMMP